MSQVSCFEGSNGQRNLFSLPSDMNQGERNGFSMLRMRWMPRAGVLPSARRKAFSHSYWRRQRRPHDQEIYHFQGNKDVTGWISANGRGCISRQREKVLATPRVGGDSGKRLLMMPHRCSAGTGPLTSWNLILLYCLVWYKYSAFKRIQASAHCSALDSTGRSTTL